MDTFKIKCNWCEETFEYEGHDGKTESADYLPDGYIIGGKWYCYDCCKEHKLVKSRDLNEQEA